VNIADPKPASQPSSAAPDLDEGKRQKAKGKRGRPREFSDEQVKAVAEEIGRGVPERYACLLHGVSYPAWAKRKQRDPDFVLAVELEQAKFIRQALGIITMDLPGHVGCRWLLERRHEEFRKADVSVTVNANQSVGLQLTPEFQKELALYARRLDAGAKGGRK
jgi:hypothetical protein